MEQAEKIIGTDAWEMEDYLQTFKSSSGRPVFCWMFDEMSSRHTDSYGTCLNYTEFFEAFDKSTFTKEQWLDSADYWVNNPNCGKPLKLIGLYLQSDKDKIWGTNAIADAIKDNSAYDHKTEI